MLNASISSFLPIDLDGLNAGSALLDREEHKYLVTADELPGLLDMLKEDYFILEIAGRRMFGYRSQYYDTEHLLGYKYHSQGRIKRRFKVRSRLYVDSQLCFFEVKLKTKRGGTIKKRFTYDTTHYGTITPEAEAFFGEQFEATYSESFDFKLSPKVEVTYDRITLVAKRGGERLTIDLNLRFSDGIQNVATKPMAIIETKTPTGYGIADALMRRLKIRSQSCSKYCLGANLLGYDVKYNKFKQLLRAYDALPTVRPVPAEPLRRAIDSLKATSKASVRRTRVKAA